MHALKQRNFLDFQKAHYLCAIKVTDEAFHLYASKREMFPFTKNGCLSSWDRPAVPVGNGEIIDPTTRREAHELLIDVMLMVA